MKENPTKPNILFLLSDDQGAWAMNCAGTSDLLTPNLDRLAQTGLRFDNFFCSSPVCSPARASILTGTMPSANGIHDWLCGGNVDTEKYPYMKEKGHEHFTTPDCAIPYLKGQRTYVQELSDAGYWCALSGKWHVGDSVNVSPGFSGWFTIAAGGCQYYHGDTVENNIFTYESRYITDIITDRAIQFLNERPKDRPFYLSVHYTAPHSPWTKENHPKEFLDLYSDCEFNSVPNESLHPRQVPTCPIGDTPEKRKENLRGYFAAITAMDAGIGKILDCLSEQNLLNNTIIIFTADNGMNMGHHGVWGKGNGTYPPNMYDSSIKVPFIIRIPGMQKAGQVTHRTAKQCDIYSTILDLAGIIHDRGEKQPGKSLLPFLKGEDKDENGDIFVCDEYGFVRMYRTEHYKLVRRYIGNLNEFYDIKNDPDEKENLIHSEEYQEIITDMTAKLEQWFEKYSVQKFSGKTLPVSGRGQKKICYEEDAFVQM